MESGAYLRLRYSMICSNEITFFQHLLLLFYHIVHLLSMKGKRGHVQKECTRQNNSIFVKLNNRYNIFGGIDTRALHNYIT